ncbi:hypothetical protein VKS41_002800 [Umbelopsis sp. WA50703]
MLYRQPIWQCETTGRSNLTYVQALESERKEKERVDDRFPEQLKECVLKRLQFRTERLETVVEDIYTYFLDRYLPGEVIHCRWDDGIMYNARILDVVNAPQTNGSVINGDSEKPDTNGTAKLSHYRAQLIDQDLEGIEDCIHTVTSNDLKRDRLTYSKNMLKKVIRECAVKDTYVGAPWVVKPAIAERYNIDSTLPAELQAVKDKAMLKSRKRKAQNGAEKADDARAKAQSKEEEMEARKRLMSLKYPIEDLDLPIYRRPDLGKTEVPLQAKAERKITDPLGNHGVRPSASEGLGVPSDQFTSFLLTWNFLNTFSRPLHLTPFTIDDFEQALHYTASSPPAYLIIEANVALLNVIIRERRKKTTSGPSMISGNLMIPVLGTSSSRSASPAVDFSGVTTRTNTPDLEGNGDIVMKDEANEDVSFSSDGEVISQFERTTITERGWGSSEAFNVGKNWSSRPIGLTNDRQGWEMVLIGCLNELANPSVLPDLDNIIRHLLPSENPDDDDEDDILDTYPTLSVVQKIQIFDFLVHVVNECMVIKEYMEDCQDHMTELRKERIEVNRELKRIMADRLDMDRADTDNENDNAETEETNDSMQSESEALSDEEEEEDEEEEDIRKVQRRAEHESRHKSRQAKLKQRQLEREAMENRRLKLYQQQRAEARAKSQEMKLKTEQRRKLDESERQLHKKLEQIERDMRKFATLRVRPLGRDRFYNKYYYFDNIGGSCVHGTSRLYVQSPNDADILVLSSRDEPDPMDAEELPCGRGGGTDFVTQLMRAQGLQREADWLQRRILTLRRNLETSHGDSLDRWYCYSEPEDIDALLEWLNPQGVREYRLKNEIEKQYHGMITGMKKRTHDQQSSSLKAAELPRRSTRTKTVVQIPLGSWLAYTNKAAI